MNKLSGTIYHVSPVGVGYRDMSNKLFEKRLHNMVGCGDL